MTRVYISALSVLSILFLGSCGTAADDATQIVYGFPPLVAPSASSVAVTSYLGAGVQILDVSHAVPYKHLHQSSTHEVRVGM